MSNPRSSPFIQWRIYWTCPMTSDILFIILYHFISNSTVEEFVRLEIVSKLKSLYTRYKYLYFLFLGLQATKTTLLNSRMSGSFARDTRDPATVQIIEIIPSGSLCSRSQERDSSRSQTRSVLDSRRRSIEKTKCARSIY